jgi:hypothetical protein
MLKIQRIKNLPNNFSFFTIFPVIFIRKIHRYFDKSCEISVIRRQYRHSSRHASPFFGQEGNEKETGERMKMKTGAQ